MQKKKRRFIHNALILTLISLIMRVVSMWFMIYISNHIGSEGMGLYQLVSSIYSLAITLAISGITVAVIRIVSEQAALGNASAVKKTMKISLFISLILGLISCAILYTNADMIGNKILNDSRTILSLKYLSFGLPFMSTAAVIRGYFMGLVKPVKSVSTEIIELLSMIAVTVPILTLFMPKGLEYACCGLMLGSTLSEIISCLSAFVLYLLEKTKQSEKNNSHQNVKGICKKIFNIAAPIAASNYIRSILVSLENILIPKGLKQFGSSKGEALSGYGMIKGMTMPILFFPSAILSAFSSLLVPEVSSANAINAQNRISFIINKCFKVTLMFAILVTGIFITFSKELSLLLYDNKKVGAMLLILAPLVPLLYLDQIVDSILKGLNQQLSSMRYNTIDSVLRVLIIYFLVPVMGLKGYIIMLYAGTIFNASLSINRLILVSRVHFKLIEWLLLPTVAAIISCALICLAFKGSVIFSIVAVTVLYIILLFLFKCITKNDIAWVKRVFIPIEARK